MIKRLVVKCDFCKEKILLRFQMGYFDIPFDFYCPNCGISISGTKLINSNRLILNNAQNIGEDIEDVRYYGNFSTEFLNKKISKFNCLDDIISDNFGPFMNSVMIFNTNEEYIQIMDKVSKFLRFKNTIWKNLNPLYELFFNDKLELIKTPLSNYSNNYIIKNDLDATIALHQLTIIGISNIMPANTLKEYIETTYKIMLGKDIKEIFVFIDFLKSKIDFKYLSQKIIQIYDKFIVNFEKYMAVIILSLGDKTSLIDKENYGISTINFENMKLFFVESYELILEMITLPIGLNNIIERKQYNNFSEKSNVKNFNSYFNQSKYNRIKSLISEETFSKNLNMDRHVRNALSHYDYKLDKKNQIITFYDWNKNKSENIEMYIFDFALLCYENIKLIVYLNELFYCLKKLNYLQMGMKPHINLEFKNES